MTFDAVIFDLDGLLLDTERLAIDAGHTALARLGHRVDISVLHGLIGLDHQRGLTMLNAHLGVTVDGEALARAWSEASEDITEIAAKPGALALLDHLDALAVPFAVATNSRRAGAERKVACSPLAGRIARLTSFEEVARGKPAPDVYLEAARRLDCDPARSLAFEDSDVGVAAARAAGMTVVQVPDLIAPTGDTADHVAETLLAGATWAGFFDTTPRF